jgi:hypothetical protein
MNKLLIIGYIWPEPHRTAAGYRMLQIIDLFLEQQYEVVFCCASKVKTTSIEPLESRGIAMIPIQLNSDAFDLVLEKQQPDIVMYDRFLVEEQYGWRVRKMLPDTLQILDTEDLHFLRNARKEQVENGISLEVGLRGEMAVREVSSMLRVDFSLIISTVEMELLMDQFNMDQQRLFHLPFLIQEEDIKQRSVITAAFEKRTGFCTIGNLRHAPNLDAVQQLKAVIWPQMRELMPDAQLYIYGSNAPKEVLEMNHPQMGFYIKGHAASVDQVLQKHKVLLAPLRYGAGLKGKLFDAMKNGIPSVMTPIAAEGMFTDHQVPGMIMDLSTSFSTAAVSLYADAENWNQYQKNGFIQLQDGYEESAFAKALFHHINLHLHKTGITSSFQEQMLKHHADAHFKFMSYWINAKKAKD